MSRVLRFARHWQPGSAGPSCPMAARRRRQRLQPAVKREVSSMLFPTTLVGSYPQPDWLIDRQRLAGRFPPRVRVLELWRVPQPLLQQAQDDATIVAIKAQEDAG